MDNKYIEKIKNLIDNKNKKVIFDKKNEAKSLMTEKQFSDCNIAIPTAAAAAAAVGAIPIPVVDAAPISAAQLTMVFALGKIFGQKLTESAAKGIIGSVASTIIGRSVVKLIPFLGWIASAAVAAGVTEAMGWTIAVDFAKKKNNKEDTEEKNQEEDAVSADDTGINDSNEDNFDESTYSDEEQNVNDKDSDYEGQADDISKAFDDYEEE